MHTIRLTPKQEAIVENTITARYFNHISVHDVYRWLSNFDEREIDLALTIFESIEYFRDDDIALVLNARLSALINDLTRTVNKSLRLHILPLGRTGKSGHAMTYYVKNNMKFMCPHGVASQQYYSYAGAIDIDKLNEQDVVIFVDDFIGSGDSFRKAVESKIRMRDPVSGIVTEVDDPTWGLKRLMSKDAKFHVALLSVIVMKKGMSRLKRTYPHLYIYGEERTKCFDPNCSVFGSYLRAKELREFCYKYGSRLTGTKYLSSPKDALGYANSQSLVAFAHAVPNNTLPIVWASKTNQGADWQPLFARQYEVRNELAYSNRVENSRWLFKLKNLIMGGEEDVYEIRDLYTNSNYQLVYLVRLLLSNVSEIIILNQMGITSTELDNLYIVGKDKGLWDDNHNLTDACVKACKEADKLIKIERIKAHKEHIELADDKKIMYIPETFRGLS